MCLAILIKAWKKLMVTFVAAYAASLLAGLVMVNLFQVAPETIFEVSTKRVAYALPLMSRGVDAGVDPGILLFIWNTFGALATISFIYTAALLNPLKADHPPKTVRRLFGSRSRMKLLCYLPGCRKIDEESLRRLYVWLMVPYVGMILLGIEVGLSASTSHQVFGSYWTGLISLLPHGIIEIPAFALAGAVTFSAHLLIKPQAHKNNVPHVFELIEGHRRDLPIKTLAATVAVGLLLAGLIEAHVTPALL